MVLNLIWGLDYLKVKFLCNVSEKLGNMITWGIFPLEFLKKYYFHSFSRKFGSLLPPPKNSHVIKIYDDYFGRKQSRWGSAEVLARKFEKFLALFFFAFTLFLAKIVVKVI